MGEYMGMNKNTILTLGFVFIMVTLLISTVGYIVYGKVGYRIQAAAYLFFLLVPPNLLYVSAYFNKLNKIPRVRLISYIVIIILFIAVCTYKLSVCQGNNGTK